MGKLYSFACSYLSFFVNAESDLAVKLAPKTPGNHDSQKDAYNLSKNSIDSRSTSTTTVHLTAKCCEIELCKITEKPLI